MLLYSLLYLTGVPGMDIERAEALPPARLARRRAIPNTGMPPASRPPPGRWARGSAMPSAWRSPSGCSTSRYGDEIVDHHTYVIAGDGCLMEGISQEAISLAGHLKLGRLIVLFDDNQISIDGPTSLSVSDDQIERFSASGWHTAQVDGHDPEAIALAIENARAATDRPSLIACRTVIGYGAPKQAGHRRDPRLAARRGRDQGRAREARLAVMPPFEVPKPILASWRAAGAAATPLRTSAGRARRSASTPPSARELDRSDRCEVRRQIAAAVTALKADFSRDAAKLATRQSSQKVLEKLVPVVPGLIGGSADLTGSNGTLTKLHADRQARRLRRQLHPLRRARARHGRGDERAGAAWRHRALRRHLPRLLRLLPPVDQAVCAHGQARDLRHDP